MGKFVKSSKFMDDETFNKHFNARHMPLAGLQKSFDHLSPAVVKMMRAYHKRVHQLGIEGEPDDKRPVNHEHRNPNKPTPKEESE